ncbi:MAG: hypothetical protein WAU91_17095 [Desulfatitalea sp.]
MFQKISWQSSKRAAWGLTLLTATLFLLSACGGGGGGGGGTATGDVSALTLPDRIQLSNAEDGAGSARAARSLRAALSRGAYNDAGTDYTNAVKRSWVDDTDALDMINTILGVCNDTGYTNFVNQGPYKALVRDKDESQESQSGGSTTSTTTESLMEIIVDVTRASNDDPMIIKIWLYVNGPGDQPMLVRGYFTVSEGVSDQYPYGAMEAHFKGNLVADGLEVMQMALSVSAEDGNVVIENVDDEGGGDYESHCKVRVEANADVTQGNAYVSDQETDWESGLLPDATISQIAFNETHFKETIGAVPTVYAKDNLRHRVFRYKLFNAETGAEISRDSGFPIEFDIASGTKNGYVGYYGLWTNNNDITLAHGDTVRKMDGTEYTVFRSAGKLTKHTASNMPLSDLDGVEFSKSTCDESGCSERIVAWERDSDTFITLGARDQNNNGQISYYLVSDPEYHAVVTFQQWEGAWCEALKAYLRLGSLYIDDDFNPSTPAIPPTDASTVYYHTEQTLSPSEAEDLILYTWSFTLGLPIDQTVIDGSSAAQSAYWSSQTLKTLYFDAETMLLYADAGHTIPVTMTDTGLILTGTNFQWGYHIGPLTVTEYTAENSWQANNAETYYTWNTGVDQWNQYVTVEDAEGNFASFDPPLSFAYTHATANDANSDATHNGKKFRIEYDGFSLNMPWACNQDSGEWEPLINLADGTQLTDADSNNYVIKGIEEALIMSEVEDPSGITFDNEEAVGAPTLEYDSDLTDLVGAVPTGVELLVIKGEVIE